MNKTVSGSLDFFIDILLFTAIFEKIQYSVFKLYDIISILFVLIVGVLALANKVIIRDSKIKILLSSKSAMFIIYILQIILVVFDGRTAIFDQYYKGVLVSLLNVLVVIAAIYYMTVQCKISTNNLLVKFARIGFINIVYNIIQYFNRTIDDTLFIRLLRSNVSRYGTDAYGAGVGRLTGLFTDSNNNAAFLIIYFMIIFILIKGLTGRKKIYLYLLLIITGLELVLTYSRTGWLGLLICLIFIFIKEGLFRNIKLVILIIAGVAIGIYAYNNNFVFHQVMTARLSSLNASNGHYVAAYNVIGILNQSPIYYLMGVGINCLSVHYETLYGRVGMKAHSLYLQVLCESGIIGLVFTLIFWGTILYICYKASKSEYKLYGLPIAIVGFLIINLTYDSAYQPLYFWILTMAVIPYREKCLDYKENQNDILG